MIRFHNFQITSDIDLPHDLCYNCINNFWEEIK